MDDKQDNQNRASPRADIVASQKLTELLNSAQTFKHQDHFGSLVNLLSSSLKSDFTSRDHYFKELNQTRNNYIVNGVYDILLNDVIIDNGENDYLTIKIEKYPEVEKECIRMFERLNVANLITSIFPEILHYGSYNLRPILDDKKGIIDLVDDLEPANVIPILDSKNVPLFFFASEENRGVKNSLDGLSYYQTSGSRTAYEYYDISQVINFSLDLSFKKLSLPKKYGNLKSKISDNGFKRLLPNNLKIKTSQSFVWPVIDKLKEVLLLDKLLVYKSIGSSLTPNLIGIPVPDTYDPVALIEIVRKYDELLNNNIFKINNNQSLEITLQELAAIKVVPVVGDRSIPQKIDNGRGDDSKSGLETLNDSLSKLLNSWGISKELFDGVGDKDNIKTNIRYAKKVKRIQKNLCRSLTTLCLVHISKKFPHLNIFFEDIEITLRNNTNIDELENLEAMDLVVSSISNIKGLLDNMQSIVDDSDYIVDNNKIIENVRSSFLSLGSQYSTIFRKRTESDKPKQDLINKEDAANDY